MVSLHARVTDETTGFLAAPQFARMKRGAYFINTARGPMVNYDDLYQALAVAATCAGPCWRPSGRSRRRRMRRCCKLDNVTLTPHIAGASTTTVRIAARMVAEEVRRYAGRRAAAQSLLNRKLDEQGRTGAAPRDHRRVPVR